MLMCLRLIVFFYSGYQKRHDENVGLSIVNFKLNNINNVTTIPLVRVYVLMRPYVRFQRLGQCLIQQVWLCTFYSKSNFAWRSENRTGLNIKVHVVGTESCYRESATEVYDYLSTFSSTQIFHSVTYEHKYY